MEKELSKIANKPLICAYAWISQMLSTLNFILRGVFDQCILHGGGKGAKDSPYLTFKPNVMETPNLACGLVFT